jgi:hypothetical protein
MELFKDMLDSVFSCDNTMTLKDLLIKEPEEDSGEIYTL